MVFLVVRLELKMQAVDSIMINELISSYSGSKGPFLKFLGWNNHPCARFDKAPETARGLWSHKQVTSFPSEKSVQDLNWVTNWLLPHPQGINDVTAKLIGFIKELHHMGLKTSFDVRNKQYNSERPCFLLEVWLRNVWLKFETCEYPTTESTLLEEEALFELFPAVASMKTNTQISSKPVWWEISS